MLQSQLSEAGRFERRGRRVPEFSRHMADIYNRYRQEVGPMADWRNPATADDVYSAIMRIWSDASAAGGISQQELVDFKNKLDDIRREWAEQPQVRDNYNNYFHKIGPHPYMTEKEHLASFPAHWYTAGAVGHAGRFAKESVEQPTEPIFELDVEPESEVSELPGDDIADMAAHVFEDITDTWCDKLLCEQVPQAAPAPQAAPTQQAAAPQAAQPNNVEQAKKAGAQALKSLIAQLQILKTSPDWQTKVLPDLKNQLKPWLA